MLPLVDLVIILLLTQHVLSVSPLPTVLTAVLVLRTASPVSLATSFGQMGHALSRVSLDSMPKMGSVSHALAHHSVLLAQAPTQVAPPVFLTSTYTTQLARLSAL